MHDIAGRVCEFFKAELARQHEHLFLWMPVFLSIGIAVYFSLLFEPPLVAGAGAFAIAAIFLWCARNHGAARIAALLLLLVVTGFCAAQIRTQSIDTPLLTKKFDPVRVAGTVQSIDALEDGKGSRYILSDIEMEKLPPAQTPAKIRLSVRKDDNISLGQRISVLAALNAPSPPIMPGAFDFQRYMYFQRIGAIGFAYSQPEILLQKPRGIFSQTIERIRHAIDHVIETALPPSQAPIAKALITGKRGAIDKADNNAIKNAGLFHILSISGLHITLFATIIFFLSRLAFACWPGFALTHPIKKYAAVLGFMAALSYTLVSGAEVPAVRSLIMLGAAFLAILLDRDPLSPRLLALAALFILLIAPENLLSISFQMSFSAVAAMIFFYDWQRDRIRRMSMKTGILRKIFLYFAGIALTTILATLATAPFTIFNFQNLSLYGVIANALAIPLVGYIIMPAAVLSLFLMPLGLAYFPLKIVGWGVIGMVWIARTVSALPYAVVDFSSWPAAGFTLLIVSIILMTLWAGRLKWIGLGPVFMALMIILTSRQPDILIAPKFDLVALNTPHGLLVSSLRKEKFIRANWERMAGFSPESAQSWPKEGNINGLSCDPSACRFEQGENRLAFLRAPDMLESECPWATLILSFEPVKSKNCATLMIDKFDAYSKGAHAIWLNNGEPVIKTVEEERGDRPWVPQIKKRYIPR